MVVGIVLVNLAVLLLLAASLAGRLVRVWAERAARPAGSRLHVRLVAAVRRGGGGARAAGRRLRRLFFNLGIETWFSDRVRTTLEASLQASRGLFEEHRNTSVGDALAMAADLVARPGAAAGQRPRLRPGAGDPYRAAQPDRGGCLRPGDLRVIAHAGYTTSFTLDPPPEDAHRPGAARRGGGAAGGGPGAGRVSLDFGDGWIC